MSDILRKFRRGATLLGELIKYEAAALCAGVLKITNPRYRHVWLVSERGREARDNGYHYFAYLRRAHPEINAVYVADPKLPDYDRVAQLWRIIVRITQSMRKSRKKTGMPLLRWNARKISFRIWARTKNRDSFCVDFPWRRNICWRIPVQNLQKRMQI